MAATVLDLPQLSSYLNFPEPSLTTLLTSPTVELIRSLLSSIASRAKEYEQLQSEKFRLDVDFESVVRAGESKARVLRETVDKGLKEAEDLRKKLQEEESLRQKLESDLQTLKSSSSSSTSEVSAFKGRIASLESSNRDTLSLLESKCKAYDELTSELSTKHQKTIELRQEISALEQSVRSANATVSSSRFHEQALQAEVESLKRNNDWLEQELKTKSSEYSKFRKDKNARVAELQRTNEEAVSAIEVLQRSETTLKQRLDEVNRKAEDFLSQIQQLKEDAARQEESFRTELDTSNRLTELLQNSVETERRRQKDLSEQLEKAKEDAAEEIGRINAEIETEHQDRLAAERRVAELEIHVERLEADISMQEKSNTRPGTPNYLANGNTPATPRRLESPARFFSPSSSKLAGGLSMTQIITDYHAAKAELDAEKARNEKLTATIDELIQEMESHQPEVSELRADHDRLEADALEMSVTLDNLQKERDQARKDARISEGKVNGLKKESEFLRQQLRDISSQVKVLLIEINYQNQGLDDFTPDERRRLEQLARSEVDDEMLAEISATDHFIAQNLTTFKNISELQEQNTKLLRIVHELGSKLEGEEAQREKNQASQNQEELENLRQKYERCKDEMRSLVTQSQSYIRERDMFRRMLAHRGQLPPGGDMASMFGESANGSPAPGTPGRNGILRSIEQSPNTKDLADYAKLIKEMQAHFDSYRQEAATDRSTLKAQVDGLSKTNNELRNEVSRRVSEVTIAHERYEILQGNYAMLRDANAELQKRSQTLSERAAAQELRTQQVAEDLVETRSLLESMRSESANLKAEKEFWRGVEKRLVEDNNNLTMERDRLNKLNADLQTLSNQREQSDRESRRRLQVQIEAMEAEMQATNRKLNDEIEDNKRVALRREFESKQHQARIDDLVTSLGSTREELAAAKSARDHLQARVDELTVELRSAEERVDALKPHQSIPQDDTNVVGGDNSSRTQEYALQISELKRDLELSQRELVNARTQIGQYKAISQASEEELRNMNETQDQYREEMDRVIEENTGKIQELGELVHLLRSQISSAQTELASLQSEKAESNQKLDEQRSLFESEIARLKDSSERSETAAHFYQEDLKAQAEIARQAQQNYEDEIVRHGEAAKSLQKLRGEYNQLRLEVAELKTEAESARSNLSQSEESWAEAKARYERELGDLRSRRDDIQSQNKLLHQQLEHVSGQISALQQEQSPSGDETGSSSAVTTSGTDNTNELIRYLRREKEIVDVQWELATQETKRLRQTLDHTQVQLDEARLKLTQQRRAEENSERSALNHNKLMETIHELNLNRESNVTLRLEKNQAEATLAEKLKIIEELQEQIQPLQANVRELQDTLEIQNEELRMAREARERFEQRYHDLLNKSNSVDPVEFDALKEEVTNLREERDALLAVKDYLQQQVDSIPDQIKQTQDQANERFQESRSKLVEQSKAKAREQSTKIREKDAALQGISQEKEMLEAQLRERQQELDAAIQARDEARAAQQTPSREPVVGNQQNGSEDGQLSEGDTTGLANAQIIALEEKLSSAVMKAEEEALKSSGLQKEVTALQVRVAELQTVVETLKQNLDESNAELLGLKNQQQETRLTGGSLLDDSSSEQIDKLRKDLNQAQEDAESLRTTASVNHAAANIETQEGSPSIAEQISAQVAVIRAELEARHNERVRLAEENYQKRAESMRIQLSKRLSEAKGEIRQQITNELRLQHQQEIESLKSQHQAELNELRKTHEVISKDGLVSAKQEDSSNPEVSFIPADWQPTEVEVRRLIQTNPTLQSIVKKNITTQVAKEKESLLTKTLEEQKRLLAEKLMEAETKAVQDKEQAVVMEGKKYNVKLSMAENRAKASQVKIDYIQKSAIDTPEKPVGEVWEVAKNLKPPPTAIQQVQPPSSQLPTPAVNNPFAMQAPAGLAQLSGIPSNSGTPTPALNLARPTITFESLQGAKSAITPMEVAVSLTEQTVPANETRQQANGQQPSKLGDQTQGQSVAQRLNAGTGSAAMRSLQSNLPLPSGLGMSMHGNQRGGGQGRGRGRGRGGLPQVQTGGPSNAQQQQGSPQGGPLSATAKQFVPQAGKRAREEGPGLDASQHANSSKRMRGGFQNHGN